MVIKLLDNIVLLFAQWTKTVMYQGQVQRLA